MNLEALFGLGGRTALVTGGSRGIGRMVVEGFLAAGCERVYICARKQDQLAAAAAELGERVVPLVADIATVAGIDGLVSELARREDRLDILVNNAGSAWGAGFEDFPEAGWDKVVALNMKTPFFLAQKLHGLLQKAASLAQPAKVINIASIDGLRINPWETYSYQASKAGLIHLTRRMAARLISDNIVVSAIAPGAFASEMNRAARDAPEMAAQAIPAKRTGVAEDMAAGAVYLASRAGDYVVGTTLTIDGGMVNAQPSASFGNAGGG
jgi:NAD(P)-dependent dehydrogenase (short-subunit alcohol dehydrogenase family)